MEVNGATAFSGGELGTPVSREDDVLVDGRVITANNFDSAPLLGRTLAAYLINGSSTATVSIGTSFTSVSEGTATPILLPVIRGGLLEHALVIRYGTSGSATAGSDYVTLSGRLLSQPRQTTMVIELALIDDTNTEDDEDMFFELLGDPSYSSGSVGSALVSILDND